MSKWIRTSRLSIKQSLSCKWFQERVGWQVCTLAGHSSSVTSTAFSPDGTRVVSGSLDYLLKIWDAATGAEVSTTQCPLHALEIVSWSLDYFLKIWDAATGAEVNIFEGVRWVWRGGGCVLLGGCVLEVV